MREKIEQIKEMYPKEADKALIERAFEFAEKAHSGQKRQAGEPYIVHPIEAALTLAEMKMDAATIAAALLHDVVEDTPVTEAKVKKEFGKEVSFLVEGVSNLGKLKYRGTKQHAENLRKMFVAMAQDLRVILIKFADRLHNMRTLDALPEEKRRRIALETLEIYSPIAARLGVAEIGKQLEDIAFRHVYPDQYEYVKRESLYRFAEAEKYLKKLQPVLEKELKKTNLKPQQVEMRAKHFYSLWKKLERLNYNWSQIFDVAAVRIIVNDIDDCYKTLGIIHSLWKPIPGRIKDFIALPKPNGYQSLHTTVFCVDGRRIEFQIRTAEMHKNAEYGIAAHWQYKNRAGQNQKNVQKTFGWLKQLEEWKKDTAATEEFLDNLKLDVFSDRIFVFSPRGDVFDLPQGATPVDFAYAVHSDIGEHCAAALCNGKMVSLNYALENGDVVEIITAKSKSPSQAWLSFVKTRNAKAGINRWLKRHNTKKNYEMGISLINDELKSIKGKTWDKLEKKEKAKVLERFSLRNERHLFISVGRGDISVTRFINSFTEEEPQKQRFTVVDSPTYKPGSANVLIAGASGIKARLANCCNPVAPQAIAAYITVENGASVHKITCANLYSAKRRNKILPAYWAESSSTVPVSFEITTSDRIGMLQDISKAISELNINILSLNAGTPKQKSAQDADNAIVSCKVEVLNLNQLKKLTEKLKLTEGVLEVRRIN